MAEEQAAPSLIHDDTSIVMVGPLAGPHTGQRVAFERACQAIRHPRLVDSTITGIPSLLRYLSKIAAAVGARSTRCIYFTSSRSARGFLLRDFPLLLLARLFAKPAVNHLHGSDFDDFYTRSHPLLQALIRFAYRAIDLSCGPYPGMLAAYDRFEHMKRAIVANFFDPVLLKDRTVDRGEGIRILYFSNFIESKGFRTAVEAVRILLAEGHDASIILCGTIIDDDGAQRIKDFLSTVAREPFVTVRFGAFGEEKADLLFGSRFFLLPTTYPIEAVPISMIEALAAGCHVVSTDQGGIAETLDGFRSSIAAPTAPAMAAAIKAAILDGDEDRDRIHNRQLALKRHSPERFDDAIRTLLGRYR